MLKAAFLGVRHPHFFVRQEILQSVDDVQILGFYEEEQSLARRIAQESGLKQFAAPEALLEGEPDLVIIEALDVDVPRLASLAAPSARALLLEKPGAPSRTAMEQLVQEMARHDISVEVGYELHYSSSMNMCRQVLAAGAIGQVTLARFHCGCPVGCGDELWQSVPGDMGGVVFTEACHMIELILDTLGMPIEVIALVTKLPLGTSVESEFHKRDLFSPPGVRSRHEVGELMYEDVGAAILRYPDKLAVLDVTAWEPTDWVEGWRLEYFGTDGCLQVIPNPPALDLLLRRDVAGWPAGVSQYRGPRAAGAISLTPDATYENELHQLLDRLRTQAAASQEGLRHALNVMRVLDAIYASSGSGGAAVPLGASSSGTR